MPQSDRVQITWRQELPTPAQRQAWVRLWERLLGESQPQTTEALGACPRKKSLKDNALEPRRGDFTISHFRETRVLTGDRNFLEFLKNLQLVDLSENNSRTGS